MQGTAFKARKKDGSQCKELQLLLAHFKLKEAQENNRLLGSSVSKNQ